MQPENDSEELNLLETWRSGKIHINSFQGVLKY